MTAPTEYRNRFVNSDVAAHYDALFVRGEDESYGFKVLWHHEKQLLDSVLRELRQNHETIDYLDFAAGTGRIIAYLEDKVDSATGIEISPAMLEVAKSRAKRAKFVCADITASGSPVEGQYDLITAFRFFLKAEPDLRLSAMRALTARLRDERSLLVFNIHGTAPGWAPLRQLWTRIRGVTDSMTDAEVRALIREAGLRLERVEGYGQVPARIAKIWSVKAARQIESNLARWPWVPRLGLYKLYVVRLDRDERP